MDSCYVCNFEWPNLYKESSLVRFCRDCAKNNYDEFKKPGNFVDWFKQHPVWDTECDTIVKMNSGWWGILTGELKYMNIKGPTSSPTLTPPELESLRYVADGKAWKVEWSRLERLTEMGFINALGSALTKSGKEIIERNKQ